MSVVVSCRVVICLIFVARKQTLPAQFPSVLCEEAGGVATGGQSPFQLKGDMEYWSPNPMFNPSKDLEKMKMMQRCRQNAAHPGKREWKKMENAKLWGGRENDATDSG